MMKVRIWECVSVLIGNGELNELGAGAGQLLANYSNWGGGRSVFALPCGQRSCKSYKLMHYAVLSGGGVVLDLVDFSPTAEPGAFSITEKYGKN